MAHKTIVNVCHFWVPWRWVLYIKWVSVYCYKGFTLLLTVCMYT